MSGILSPDGVLDPRTMHIPGVVSGAGISIDTGSFRHAVIAVSVFGVSAPLTVTVEESDSSGSGFAAVESFSVTAADAAQVVPVSIRCDGKRKRYIRANITGGTLTGSVACFLCFPANPLERRAFRRVIN